MSNLTAQLIIEQYEQLKNSTNDYTSWIDEKTYELFTTIQGNRVYKRKRNSRDSNGNTLLYFHFSALAKNLNDAKKIASRIGATLLPDTGKNFGVFRIQKINLIDGRIGEDSFIKVSV